MSPYAVLKVLAPLEGQILSAVYCERPRFKEAIYFYFVYFNYRTNCKYYIREVIVIHPEPGGSPYRPGRLRRHKRPPLQL
jgi:hypothetical protein